MILGEWARRWAVPEAAMADLRGLMVGHTWPAASGVSEAAVQAAVRAEASRLGMRVWRNNLGAYEDPQTGGWVRYGLANDSKQVNEVVKSADLIGIRPRVIGPKDVGSMIGQFVSYECKAAGWKYTNTPRERAQSNWAALVLAMGGEAKFITGIGQI